MGKEKFSERIFVSDGHFDLNADCAFQRVGTETLVANTNKEVTIPERTMGVHFYHQLSDVVFFKLGNTMTKPTDGVYVEGGFVAPGEIGRMLFDQPLSGTLKLNLNSAAAGKIYIEFWGK